MSTIKRPSNLKPGGRKVYKPYKRRIHRKGTGQTEVSSATRAEMADVTEYTVMMSHDSRFWAPRVDESDAFGKVTVYDSAGQVIRVIAREQLVRPWQERQGNTWNNQLFPKRISDRV